MDWSTLQPKQFGCKPSEAYREGQIARDSGKLRSDCEYPIESNQARDWVKGYNDMCLYYWVKGEDYNVKDIRNE